MGTDAQNGRRRRAPRHVERELVSPKLLAERWETSRATVRRRLKAAGVQVYYLGGGARNSTIRYAVDDVEEFLRRSMSR